MPLMFEPEVRIKHLGEQLARILSEASTWSALNGLAVVVYSVDDRTHNPGTLHGWSLAVDLDVFGKPPAGNPSLFGWLARRLPDGYDVILEDTHVHAEFDVKRLPKPMTMP